ncbi:MAG: sugar phosphate isomerase/epimerase [Oscillospiraceae bacterium]|jgi:sugar phosphate isomerase/epimerase|nr:sugar phosphate isomerase/epimerase [Oscillospiraceae bacterium]
MRVGVSSAIYYGLLKTEDAVVDMQKYNVPCCEVFLESFSEYDPSFGKLIRSRLNGIEAVSMHVRSQHFEADFLGKSIRQRRDGYDWLNRALDTGAEIGVKIYVYHGPQALRGERKPIIQWADDLNRAVEMAAARGIALCWETVSWCALNSPDRVTEAIGACPGIGFTLDIKQVIETGYDPLEYVRAMGGRLLHVHALDYDADGHHALPGKGRTDFFALADALRSIGYSGDVMLEPYSWMTADEDEMHASIEYLRNAFER